jgi:hypothetical protein
MKERKKVRGKEFRHSKFLHKDALKVGSYREFFSYLLVLIFASVLQEALQTKIFLFTLGLRTEIGTSKKPKRPSTLCDYCTYVGVPVATPQIGCQVECKVPSSRGESPL